MKLKSGRTALEKGNSATSLTVRLSIDQIQPHPADIEACKPLKWKNAINFEESDERD